MQSRRIQGSNPNTRTDLTPLTRSSTDQHCTACMQRQRAPRTMWSTCLLSSPDTLRPVTHPASPSTCLRRTVCTWRQQKLQQTPSMYQRRSLHRCLLWSRPAPASSCLLSSQHRWTHRRRWKTCLPCTCCTWSSQTRPHQSSTFQHRTARIPKLQPPPSTSLEHSCRTSPRSPPPEPQRRCRACTPGRQTRQTPPQPQSTCRDHMASM